MGNNFATDLAESDVSLENSITIQLRNNHYPPVPYEMVPVCMEAIIECNEGNSHNLIGMPVIDGFQVLWRGQASAPAWAIVEGHHLDPWIDDDGNFYHGDTDHDY
jgi:hypothetical protein